MPFYINDVMYLEGITLSQEEFYEKLKNDESDFHLTAKPGRGMRICGTIFWRSMMRVVHIPMSSGLSALL